jgi:hypothetical protein
MLRLGFEHINTLIILNYLKRRGELFKVDDLDDNRMKIILGQVQKHVDSEQIAHISALPNTKPIGCFNCPRFQSGCD